MAHVTAASAASPSQPILPILKDPRWIGRHAALCRPLLPGHDNPAIPVPLVAVGYDEPRQFRFIERARSNGDVFGDALANLARRPGVIDRASIKLTLFKKVRVVSFTDDFLAAERIMDQALMSELQYALKTDLMAVGIPRRGVLLATDARQGRERLARFRVAVANQFRFGDSSPITPAVFAVSGGVTRGVLDVAGVGANAAEAARPEPAVAADYVSTMVAPGDDGLEDYVVMAGGRDVDGLEASFTEAFHQVVRQVVHDEDASGRVKLVVLSDLTPSSSALEYLVRALPERFNAVAEMAGVRTGRGMPLQVALTTTNPAAPIVA